MNGNRVLSLACLLLAVCIATARPQKEEVAANHWVLHEKAMIGPHAPVGVVWSPEVGRFLSLGWISSQYNGRKPYTYDELAFDPESGQWENWYPKGQNWGPRFGTCDPPRWKGGHRFKDSDGRVRPNWPSYYWLIGAGRNCTYLPESKSFLFYINGHTFTYDPANREWKVLEATGDPQSSTPLKRQLFWGSICYDENLKRAVLFGGGNADTDRGDPGTWTFDPSKNAWKRVELDRQPPQRANSQLAYDPTSKKTILFGGDQLDQTVADTWVFDGKKWEEKKPALSPSPRAGHALLWLPKAKKLLLLGGYSLSSTTGYVSPPYRKLPLEAWIYDEKSDAWQLLKRFEGKGVPDIPANRFLMAAVDAEDQIAVVDAKRKMWTCRIDADKPDLEGTKAHGVKPGTTERRSGAFDPAYYKDVPAAEPAKVAADLKALPVNRWTLRPTPRRPEPNMDWGSAVFSPELDLIMRYSGGHSAYSGTAPQVYDVKADRWTIPFAPEFPIDWCFTNDQVPGEWSFKGNPWMTGHTYKATAYDPNLRCMVFGPKRYTYFFDPKTGKWSRGKTLNPYRESFYTVTMVPTLNGVVTWAYDLKNGKPALWRLDAKEKTWERLPLKGPLFGPLVDNSGMGYDSRRDALLFFKREGKSGSVAASYSFATGEAKALAPTGGSKVTENFREAVYLPEEDAMLIGATGFLYDCAKNAWYKAKLPGDAPAITKEGSYNIGVMYDPNRKLVWAVNTRSQVFALSFDRKTATIEAIE